LAVSKEVKTADTSTAFTTYHPPESFTLIDLSNIIGWFGTKRLDEEGNINPDWNTKYTFWDFNNNGEIDILDIAKEERITSGQVGPM